MENTTIINVTTFGVLNMFLPVTIYSRDNTVNSSRIYRERNGTHCATVSQEYYDSEETDYETPGVKFISRGTYTAISNVILTLSLLGNILVFTLTFHRSIRTCSYGVFLRALAVTDSLVLTVLCTEENLLNVNKYSAFITRSLAFCKFWTYLRTCLMMLSPWLVVLLTVDRYIAVVFPLRRVRLCTPRTATMAVTGLTLFVLLYRVPVLALPALLVDDMDRVCDIADISFPYEHVSMLAVFSLLPCLLILVFNLQVVCTVYRRSRERRRTLQEGMGTSQPGVVDRKSFSLLMVTIMAFLTLVPVSLLEVTESVWTMQFVYLQSKHVPGEPEPEVPSELQEASATWPILFLLSLTNHGLNFYVLMATNSRFRNTLINTLLCRKEGRRLL